MTLSINGTEIGQYVELALLVGSIVGMVMAAFLVWVMVRPPKHVRQQRGKIPTGAPRAEEWEEMIRLLDRMEERLSVVESLVAREDEAPRRIDRTQDEQLLNLGEKRPEPRRTK